MIAFPFFRRAAPHPERKQPAFRPPSLIRRQILADHVIVLSVRLDAANPWLEVSRSRDASEIDRLQKVYALPLVREVFLELNGQDVPL